MRPTRKMISLNGSIIANVDGMGNLCIQKRKSTISKAIVLFFALCMISGLKSSAQISAYTFAQSTGTYSAITGTTSSATGDDGTQTGIAIGFTFNYCGTNYTTFNISTNGHIYLGSTTSYTNDLASTTNKPIIAPLWDDLFDDTSSDIQYSLTGTTPNQVLTVQWKSIRWTGSGGGQQNVQLKLYEGTNVIKFIFGTMSAPASATASIGMNDATGGSSHFISVTPAATATTSTTTANNGINAITYLTSGLTYTFTPSNCYAPSAVTSSAVTGTTATISWTAASPAPSNGYTYEIRTSGTAGSGASGLTTSGSTGAGVVSANISGLTASTTYYVYVRSYCGGSNYSSWTSSYSFATTCANVVLTYSQGFNSASIPTCWINQNVSGSGTITFPASGTNPTVSSPQEGLNMVKFDSYSATNGSQRRLYTMPITTTGASLVDVEFQWYFSNDGGSGSYQGEGVQVQYSTDGTNWTNAGSFIKRYAASSGWALQTITLPAGAGNQPAIFVGFLFTSNYGFNCYMDAAVVKPTPTTLTATTLTGFGNICTNTTVGPNSFTLTGSSLSGNVTVNALTGYTYCTTAGGTYTSTLTLTPSSGNINQVVYVKFRPTAVQSYNGNINISGGGATAINVAASGAGISGAPSITGQPSNQTVATGAGIATFTVTATGGASYQWQESTNGGSTWNNVSDGGVYSGTTTSSLVLTNALIGMNGYKYRCTVTGCSGSVTSDGNATLTVSLSYCAPTTTLSSTYINSFSTSGGTANITNNSTGYSGSGYNSYTAQSVSQYESSTINWSYTIAGGSSGVGIWVDWSGDGDFLDANESVYNSASYKSDGTYTGNFTIPSGQAAGNYRMRILVDYNLTTPLSCSFAGTRGEIEDYTVTVLTPVAMTFVSCTATQNNVNAVPPFTSNAEIIGIEVVTSGTLSPLNATYLSFLTTGSTNATTDIGNATLYYTGTSNTFATTNQFGSTKMLPNGRFSFTGTQALSAGTNYFWLAYDIPLTATLGNIVDAQCDTVTITTVRTPTTTNPTGSRVIGNVINMNNNPETVCYANFYDNGGPSGNYSDNVNYSKTFIPDAGKVIKIVFSSFNTAEASDSLTIYDGPSNASPVIGKYYGGISPSTVIASNTGELTLSFKSDGMTNTTGWSALVTCEQLPPNCATLNTPLNNANNQPTNTPITWTPGIADLTHQLATSYKLYFGTDAAATNIHNGTNIGNVTSWGMMLNTNTTYYWKIVPVNASGEATGCTTIHSFTTALTQTITTYNVPGDYATIKAAYNACTAASPYIINVTTGYTGESYPIALNADVPSVVSNRSGANPIIIRPSATFSYTFAGAANKVFEFSGGAKYITIDGRQGGTGAANSFVFTNTSASNPVVSFTGDNSYNTLQYCFVKGNNQNTGVVDLTAPSGSGIRNITIDNNEITKNTGNPTDGIVTEGTNALKNNRITISNNKIYDIYADVAYPVHGIYFGSNGYNCNCSVTGNSVYLTTTVTPTSNHVKWYGILAKGNNHVISSNYIGGTASSCGGTALTIAGNKENQLYGINVVGTSASSTTSVEYNTVTNISLSTRHRSYDNLTGRSASGSDQTLAGITIVDGAAKVHNNNIGGSTAGSITVINTNTANPATVNNGTTWGYSAELVGIVYNTKTGTINNTGNTIQGLWCYPSSTATTNLNSRVIGIYAYTDNVTNSGYTHNIQNNIIGGTGGLKAGNNTTSDGFVIGIHTSYGNGTIRIKNNTISNLWVNSTGDYGFLHGIHNNGGIRAEIQNNTISNLVTSAENTYGALGDFRNNSIVGLMCDNDAGAADYFFIIKNTIYDLRSTATSATVHLIGLYYRHSVAPVYGRVFGNKIYSINASTTTKASKLIGMWAYGQNTITYNNMITIGSNVSAAAGASCPNAPVNTGGYELIGIENNYGKNEYYYNTVNIVGTTGVGDSNSYAYKYVNPGTEVLNRVFRNNIFSNTRSSIAGTAKHYAFSVSLQEGYGKFTSDFNYFYVSGTNGILFDDFGTDRTTIAAWTASSGQDANSTGTGVLTPADPLFVAPCNCECNLDITDLTSPIVGTGSTIGVPTFILDDFNNFSRNSNNNVGAVIVGANTLPIELLSFTGKKVNKVTLLEWITSTEINNDRFNVERSSDGIHFEPIATVKGAGNSNSSIRYEVIDENPLNGINYYRLKQTDYDGAFSYSNIVAIHYSDESFMVQVYPNPFNQKINVNITGVEDEEAQISVYDIAGKQIFRQSVNNAGNNFQIELESSIPNGVYFMTVQVANVVKHIKIVKSNK